MSNRFFYSNIPIIEDSFIDIIGNKKRFQKVPGDWYVVVSDIEKSTEAFDDGKYKALNTISASTIAIAVNVATNNGITIPFIYGGDGGTMLVPPEIIREVLGELVTLKNNALKNFDLNLRVGSIEVSEIEEAGKELLVAKFLVAENYTQAVFLGEGLYFAERKIKDDKRLQTKIESESRPLDLEGLQCRWDTIKPPRGKSEALTLIVQSSQDMDTKTYLKILHDIEEIYGDFNQRHPITPKQTYRILGIGTLVKASKLKYGRTKPIYVLWNFLRAFLHSIIVSFDINITLFRHDDFTEELLTATDTLKIDGALKTIIAGTKRQRERLIKRLEYRERRGYITFGYHISSDTTLTCYIHKRNQEYINLIDGTNGGYVQAAKMIKLKKQTYG